jgi:hypothetical protein
MILRNIIVEAYKIQEKGLYNATIVRVFATFEWLQAASLLPVVWGGGGENWQRECPDNPKSESVSTCFNCDLQDWESPHPQVTEDEAT